ncbi:MAG: Rieske (2Fe-2S) protein [Anaerolineales bacterium]|nr:MAG: Rieske (2Fe-2S) protein [Anaerolineales bacterium]
MMRLRFNHWRIRPVLLLVCVTSCTSPRATFTPFAPVDWVVGAGGVVRRSLPIHLHVERFQLDSFGADGTLQPATYDEVLFPVDVYVVYDPATQAVRAFLARSPHGGCLLNYVAERSAFEDPCYGSRFDLDGAYQAGPSPRDLDQLPVELREQLIWVKNELVYGKEHP